MCQKQARIDAALQSVIPEMRQALRQSDLWLRLYWNHDENVIYIGENGAFRFFWHDPSDRYCCEQAGEDRWQPLVIDADRVHFTAKAAAAIAAAKIPNLK